MKLLLIHTGGTIGMVRSPSGFTPQIGIVEDQLAKFVAAGSIPAQVEIKRLTPLIDSANAAPMDWCRIAEVIHDSHDHYDGFVVTHGTDTLAYTAAALCFALQGLARPVVLTGSMLPLPEPETDGVANLLDALVAAPSAPAGVWVQFAGRLLHGGRVRKSHSRAFDAFAADLHDAAPQQSGARALHTYGTHRVAVLPVSPGMPTDLTEMAAERCDGLVLRCYGSGTVPGLDGLRRALERAQTRDIPVLATSQCPEGGIALGTYAAGAVLHETGAIDGHDMTVEAAYAKLLHALARSSDPDMRRALLLAPLAGEMSAR